MARNKSRVVGIDHISIRVSDYEKSKAFYARLFAFLGFELSDDYGTTIGWTNGRTRYWIAPAEGSRVERAFRLFLDYDGQGSRVTGDSVRATSANVDALGAYGVDAGDRTLVLLFNKDTVAHTAQVTLEAPRNGAWQLYRFDAASDVAQVGSGNIAAASISMANLPPRSATLLVLPAANGVADRIFANGFEGP